MLVEECFQAAVHVDTILRIAKAVRLAGIALGLKGYPLALESLDGELILPERSAHVFLAVHDEKGCADGLEAGQSVTHGIRTFTILR